jgi:signal transduction histidine kinase
MGLGIRHIATRFALLLALSAVLPLLAYGVVSIRSLQRGTRTSVIEGNENVVTRAAEEVRRYIMTNADLLKALGADLQNTGLQQWQQDRIVKNFVLQFREFREITLFNATGGVTATSRIGEARVSIPRDIPVTLNGVAMSPTFIDNELLPTAVFSAQMMQLDAPSGWLVGEFSLEQLWRMVDRIRIGEHGYAMVVAPTGELLAHGDPDKKALVAQRRSVADHPLVTALTSQPALTSPVAAEYSEDGGQWLGVGTRMEKVGWIVIVEQPTREAYATQASLQRQLIIAIVLALLVLIAIGYTLGRGFIRPIIALKQGTQAVAAGRLDARVDIRSRDEFADLGDAFNSMAGRLSKLQEDVKRQERQATLGRLAAGFVHDLSHPVQNIGNSIRLLFRDDIDTESSEVLRRTVDRELGTLRRFMEDLRNLANPKPIERFAVDVNGPVAEAVESMRGEGQRAGVTIDVEYADGPLSIDGDRFAIGRVFRNLVANAVQATPPGGRVVVQTARMGDKAVIRVSDTGSGIPRERLETIFEEFMTTKRGGLGLGLAISKRIVEQLDGTIHVESDAGRGTVFTVTFQAREEPSAEFVAS